MIPITIAFIVGAITAIAAVRNENSEKKNKEMTFADYAGWALIGGIGVSVWVALFMYIHIW
jgi:hypothetical protein